MPLVSVPTGDRRSAYRSAGLALGVLADLSWADPQRGHPVAVFGSAAAWCERYLYRDSRTAGVVFCATAVGVVTATSWTLHRSVGRSAQAALTAAATWAALGGTSLSAEGAALGAALERNDLTEARRRLPSLCGRNPDHLDSSELARAALESVAENTTDAVVATLFWGALAGGPGIMAHRAVNTLDAMVGHRNARYGRFGWASARLDDAMNWMPARITAMLTCAVAPLVGGSPREAWRIWRRDGARHPSPNSGQSEAAFAGALGVRLGGANTYGEHVEHRPVLGDGPRPSPVDLARAVRLSRAVGLAATVLAVTISARRGGLPRRGDR